MSHYTFEVQRTIVVTVEAPDEQTAREDVYCDIENGEYSYSIDRANPTLILLDSEE